MVTAFILIILTATLLIPLVHVPWKGLIAVASVLVIAIITSIISFQVLFGSNYEIVLQGTLVTGKILLKIDAIAAWFILVINFTCITGVLYGVSYMKAYQTQKDNLSMHWVGFIFMQTSLISICVVQNMIAFLISWEIMALSSFILVIFEYQKRETLKAGINYLIQSHIGIMFLTLGFIWVSFNTNSFDFNAITQYSTLHNESIGTALFLCFFVGFAIKAGFVPFHTWLPYAHPAAPSHVSGVMSGVIIKIGIYGILRMLLLIKLNFLFIGYFILLMSIISGVYGVMLAIIQHNLKRLLAYHSIENIGIIGIGIGLGCIGIGNQNYLLIVLGFSGALLHTLNHSLFKSLLFYSAGNVYQATHTLDIEQLGGIGKKMPHTSGLFLIAALAICGLPPFNGFVSEFIIYSGMITGLNGADKALLSYIVLGLFSLALIGGLAILCFTKAFGAVFLGNPRHIIKEVPSKEAIGKLIPMYAIVLFIVAIGLFPSLFLRALSKPVGLYITNILLMNQPSLQAISTTVSLLGIWAIGFIVLASLIYLIRWKSSQYKSLQYNSTWGCGYTAPTSKMQYTASSFVRAYRKLAEPILSIHKVKKEITSIFPITGGQETHPYDSVEKWFIDYPINRIKTFLNRFVFLQNGNLQFYILYGVSFIILVLIVPLVFNYILLLINFFKTL